MNFDHYQAERNPRRPRVRAMALAAALILLPFASANAFVYASGNVVALFIEGDAELYVNLGPLAALSAGAVYDIPTPPGFGSNGAVGARFMAYATVPPFSGTLGRNVTYTVPPLFYPSTYDANITGFVSRVGLAQAALDDGGASDKFLEVLTLFPLPPTGGIVENSASRLVVPTSNVASYTSTIGVAGTSDRIDNQLPFETDIPITSTHQSVLWTSQRITTLASSSLPVGVFEVVGNLGGGTPTARITFLPEPGSAIALGSGAALLGWLGQRRRNRAIRRA